MDRKRKAALYFLIFLSIIFGSILLFAGFHSQDTLTVGIFSDSCWDVPGTDYYAIVQEAVKKFQEKYPNIKVKYEEGIPSDDYSDWLASAILKGDEPDVYFVLSDDFPTLVKTGALCKLDSLILKDGDFDENLFYSTTYECGQKDGGQYAIPFECNPRMMFVNKTLLKKEGVDMPSNDWNWDDFYEICKKVTEDTDGDGVINQFGYYDYTWLDAFYSNGIQPFSEEGDKSMFSDQDALESIEFIKKLRSIYDNYTLDSNDFDLGKVAFRPLSFAEYRTYMPYPWRIKKYSQFEWNCVSMPASGSGNNTSSMDTLMIGMSSGTINTTVAWEFIKTMTTDEDIQYEIYEHSSGASVLKNVTTSSKVMTFLNEDTPGDSKIDMSLLDQVINNAVVTRHFAGYDTAMEYADNYIQSFLESDDEMNLSMFQLDTELKNMLK